MKKLLLLSLFLLLSLPAFAVKWHEAGKSIEGHIYYIDSDRFELTDNGAKFWLKYLYKYPKGYPVSRMKRLDGQRVWYTLSSYSVNCENKTYTGPYSLNIYGLSHQLLDTYDDAYPSTDEVVPDSVAEGWTDYTCTVRSALLNSSQVEEASVVEDIDPSRWKLVSEKSAGSLYLDTDSITSIFSPMGYKVWVKALLNGELSNAWQVSINCKDRTADYKAIAPESPYEDLFNYLCKSRSVSASSAIRPSHCKKYPLNNPYGLVSYPSECAP